MRTAPILARGAAFLLIQLAPCGAVFPAHAAQPGRYWTTGWFAPGFLKADTRAWGFEHDYAGYTVRQIVRMGADGRRLRIRFGNETGDQALKIAAASVMTIGKGKRTPKLLRVAFGGRASTVIAPGAPRYSDAVDLPVRRFDELAISVRFERGPPVLLSGHLEQMIIAPGDWIAAGTPPAAAIQVIAPSAITAIEIEAPRPQPVLVAIGDSITEGLKSTTGKYRTWPDLFAERLAAQRASSWSVINAGISGNRLLSDRAGPNLLARFDRDAFSPCGASAIVVLIGINDITHSPEADAKAGSALETADLVAGYEQIISRAHQRGFRIYGGTILPFLGPQKTDPLNEALRTAVNQWIRTAAKFDGVIDFDVAMRDPAHPQQMLAAYDSGDHVHPGDAGYRRMASVVPLSVASGAGDARNCRTSRTLLSDR